MGNDEIRRPDLVPVPAGQKYSRCCGGEQRCSNERAPFDGVAVDGVLFSLDEYMAPVLALTSCHLKPPKRARKAKR